MSKFGRIKKVLSLIMGITNFNLMNVEAVKRFKGKKISPDSKTIFSAKKSVLKKKNVSNAFETKKKVNFKNKKGNKKKNIGLKSVRSVKKDTKMNNSQKRRTLRLLRKQNIAPKANGGYFIDKNGKLRWKNVGITSAWGIPTAGVVGTGIGVGAKKMFGSKENTSNGTSGNSTFLDTSTSDTSNSTLTGNVINTSADTGQTKVNSTVNYKQKNTNEHYANNSNSVQSGNDNLKFNTNNVADVFTQYNSFNDLQAITVQQVSVNKNNDLPAENYEEALKLVEEAFKNEKLPKGDPISLKASFSGSTLDSNEGKGHNAKADTVYHSKKVQHNLKLFLWKQLPKRVLSMTANEFEVWLVLQFLKGTNLNKSFFDHEFAFGNSDDKVSIKLSSDFNVHWKLGQNIGKGISYRYGSDGNFKISNGGIVEKKAGIAGEVSSSFMGKTQYGSFTVWPTTFGFNIAELTYNKQLEAAVRSCMNWEALIIGGKKIPTFKDSHLKHLNNHGKNDYVDVVNSILKTLCEENMKEEKGITKFSAGKRLKGLKSNVRAMNFLRMVALVRYFGLYISFGYKFREDYKMKDSTKQVASAMAMAALDKLYDPSSDSKKIWAALKYCGGILDPKDMIDYGLGTIYRVVGDAGNGCFYIG